MKDQLGVLLYIEQCGLVRHSAPVKLCNILLLLLLAVSMQRLHHLGSMGQ